MNRKPYVPPCMHTVRLQLMLLLQVSKVESEDVNWTPEGFNDTDYDR